MTTAHSDMLGAARHTKENYVAWSMKYASLRKKTRFCMEDF